MNPFQIFAAEHNLSLDTKTFDQTTHTAQQAAAALGCEVAQIAKSIVFYKVETNEPILVVASGKNRVDKEKLSAIVGVKIKTAGPEFVIEHTGFSPGSVPPFGHIKEIKTYIDKDLKEYNILYAAAGRSDSVFAIDPQKLAEIAKGEFVDVKEEK